MGDMLESTAQEEAIRIYERAKNMNDKFGFELKRLNKG